MLAKMKIATTRGRGQRRIKTEKKLKKMKMTKT